jgi:hypothetical protein
VHAQSTDVDVVEVLTGLYGFRVKTEREAERPLEVEVESAAGVAACPECGVFSASLKQGPDRPQRELHRSGGHGVLWLGGPGWHDGGWGYVVGVEPVLPLQPLTRTVE